MSTITSTSLSPYGASASVIPGETVMKQGSTATSLRDTRTEQVASPAQAAPLPGMAQPAPFNIRDLLGLFKYASDEELKFLTLQAGDGAMRIAGRLAQMYAILKADGHMLAAQLKRKAAEEMEDRAEFQLFSGMLQSGVDLGGSAASLVTAFNGGRKGVQQALEEGKAATIRQEGNTVLDNLYKQNKTLATESPSEVTQKAEVETEVSRSNPSRTSRSGKTPSTESSAEYSSNRQERSASRSESSGASSASETSGETSRASRSSERSQGTRSSSSGSSESSSSRSDTTTRSKSRTETSGSDDSGASSASETSGETSRASRSSERSQGTRSSSSGSSESSSSRSDTTTRSKSRTETSGSDDSDASSGSETSGETSRASRSSERSQSTRSSSSGSLESSSSRSDTTTRSKSRTETSASDNTDQRSQHEAVQVRETPKPRIDTHGHDKKGLTKDQLKDIDKHEQAVKKLGAEATEYANYSMAFSAASNSAGGLVGAPLSFQAEKEQVESDKLRAEAERTEALVATVDGAESAQVNVFQNVREMVQTTQRNSTDGMRMSA